MNKKLKTGLIIGGSVLGVYCIFMAITYSMKVKETKGTAAIGEQQRIRLKNIFQWEVVTEKIELGTTS